MAAWSEQVTRCVRGWMGAERLTQAAVGRMISLDSSQVGRRLREDAWTLDDVARLVDSGCPMVLPARQGGDLVALLTGQVQAYKTLMRALRASRAWTELPVNVISMVAVEAGALQAAAQSQLDYLVKERAA